MFNKIHVSGEVVDRATRAKVRGAVVEAVRRDTNARTIVGRATSNRRGRFAMNLSADYPDVEFTLQIDHHAVASADLDVETERHNDRLSVMVAVDPPDRATSESEITGQLRSAAGYPVALTSVVVHEITHARQSNHEEPIATALTDTAGRFRLVVDTAHRTGALRVVASAGDTQITADVAVADLPATIQLTMPLPTEPLPNDIWAELGQRMRQAGITQVNELVKQLIRVPTTQSAFGDWSLANRHAIVQQLEQAFVDPTGELRKHAELPRLRDLQSPARLAAFQRAVRPSSSPQTADTLAAKAQTFQDLTKVDWKVDVDSLMAGDVGNAVTATRTPYAEADTTPKLQPPDQGTGGSGPKGPSAGAGQPSKPGPVPGSRTSESSDQVGYRNYLRAVWVDTGTRKYKGYVGDPNNPRYPSEAAAIKALESRLRQDFRTTDTYAKPANELLIPILKSILIAPTGKGYGFGIAASAIQPRGDRSARDYLDYLIGLSGVSDHELRNRYRVDLTRSDAASSNPVQENIATLQGFLTDSFQCVPEPNPIIASYAQGVVPFYLEYDEWLWSKLPFYGENAYSPKRPLDLSNLRERDRTYIKAQTPQKWKWVIDVLDMVSLLEQARTAVERGQYPTASNRYVDARLKALNILLHGSKGEFKYYEELQARRAIEVYDIADTKQVSEIKPGSYDDAGTYDAWYDKNRVKLLTATTVALYVTIPAGLAETALRLGDYALAISTYGYLTNFWVAAANFEATASFPPVGSTYGEATTYLDGDLAYTAGPLNPMFGEGYPHTDVLHPGTTPILAYDYLGLQFKQPYQMLGPDDQHPIEAAYFRLRQGEAILDWAEALYRSGQLGQVARARETYKAVLWLHGVYVDITPSWSTMVVPALPSNNPIVASQVSRARLRLAQLDAGLNYFGYAPDHVPVLHYRPLREAADRFASLAKAAQQDFLIAMERIESGIIEGLETSTMLKKATLQTEIANEYRRNAEVAVDAAKLQVKHVQKAIAAKEAEIKEHDSLLGQFKDYVGGLASTAKDLKDAKIDYGAMWMSMQSGSGAGGMAGYGLFLYASYSSASSMEAAANSRAADLHTLRYEVLPAAKAQVDVRNREVAIAQLQHDVAAADADLASELLKFQRLRFLSLEFWTHVATFMRRLLMRYLELGASAAWLAQRALSYEQSRQIDIIQFDYFPVQQQGVTGADMLQLHLAELEAVRLEGTKALKPIKHTFSLAGDYPLAFGQLKKTGRCVFRTEGLMLQRGHPGTYWHRIRAVDLRSVLSSATQPALGMLRNDGVSRLSRIADDGTEIFDVLARPADALPMSEYALTTDGAIHGIPGEALAPFEGSGVDTFWHLDMPPSANPHGLGPIADVLITLHVDARYSAELFEQHIAMKSLVRRLVWVSAAQHDPAGLASLVGGTSDALLKFDLVTLGLPSGEKSRKVTNVACFVAGVAPDHFTASVAITQPATTVPVTFDGGAVISNAAPFTQPGSATAPSPLNQLVGKDATQVFTVAISKSSGADFSGVADVVFGVEYEATPA